MLGSIPIEQEIDKKKLIFLGQLCRLPTKFLSKQIFVNRLFAYENNMYQMKGFIPDIHIICKKYSILYYLDTFK